MTEGSLSKRRALVVIQTSPRLKNNEGSVFQYNRINDWLTIKLRGWKNE